MLSLRSSPLIAINSSPKKVYDLPSEVIDLIIWHLYHGVQNCVENILSASRVCWKFRQSALPLMFESVSCVIRQHPDDHQFTVFEKLQSSPHLLKHVRFMHIQRPIGKQPHVFVTADKNQYCEHDLTTIGLALQNMPKLQLLRIKSTLSSAAKVLASIPSGLDLIVVLDTIWLDKTDDEFDLSGIHAIKALPKTMKLGLGQFGALANSVRDSEFGLGGKLVSVRLECLPSNELVLGRFSRTTVSSKVSQYITSLEELCWSEAQWHPQLRHPIIEHISWESLLRLSLHVAPLTWIAAMLDLISPRLSGLRILHLRSASVVSFHADCPFRRPQMRQEYLNLTEAQLTPVPRMDKLYLDINFSMLSTLSELEIDGICPHVPIAGLVSPQLRRLRLHCPDASVGRLGPDPQRSVVDLNHLARVAPRLMKLELDIGSIKNLWHPTAIPGVDINVDIYRFLSVVCKFKSLKFLRIFPPYVAEKEDENQSIGILNPGANVPFPQATYTRRRKQQPVSDEQAIRIYNYLQRQGLGLEVFAISPSDSVSHRKVFAQSRQFDPMNWEVRSVGGETHLTTRQIYKDYEQQQIWVGERKIRSRIKRHGYVKEHFLPSEEWFIQQMRNVPSVF